MISGKNYIGNSLSGLNSKTYTTFNPQLNEANKEQFHEATPKEINEAVLLATVAFESYKKIAGSKKAEF